MSLRKKPHSLRCELPSARQNATGRYRVSDRDTCAPFADATCHYLPECPQGKGLQTIRKAGSATVRKAQHHVTRCR
jgi:hypothetical protein